MSLSFLLLIILKSKIALKRKHNQKSLNNFVKKVNLEPYGRTSNRKQLLDNAVVKFVIRSLQPLCIVDKECFVKMLEEFDPKYKLPSRRTLRDVYINNAYLRTIENVICGLDI